MRIIRRFIVHWLGGGCSQNYVSKDAVERIRYTHVHVNGWNDIGYHDLIDRNGKVYPGRPEDIPGAHAQGANFDSIGINVMFGLDDKALTPEALTALVNLLKDRCQKYHVEPSRKTIIGHCDVLPTQCPGIVYPHLQAIVDKVRGFPIQNEPPGTMDHPPETNEIRRMSIILPNKKKIDGVLINSQGYMYLPDAAKLAGLTYTWNASTKSIVFGD